MLSRKILLMLCMIILQSLIKELKISRYILLEAKATIQWFTRIVQWYIEWLSKITKLSLLQIAPLITDSTQCT